MVLLAVVFVFWFLLTLPVAVLMGKCISRGLAPAQQGGATSTVPQQRCVRQGETGRSLVRAGGSTA